MVSAMLLIQVTWFRNRDHPRPDLVTWFYWSHSGLLLQVTIDLMFLSTSVPYTKCPGYSCVPVHCLWIWTQTCVLAFQDEQRQQVTCVMRPPALSCPTKPATNPLYISTQSVWPHPLHLQSTRPVNWYYPTFSLASLHRKGPVLPLTTTAVLLLWAHQEQCLLQLTRTGSSPGADNFPMNNSDSVMTTSILPSYT